MIDRNNWKEDWRLYRGQLDYCTNETLTYRDYIKKGHDHCEFCWISINAPLPEKTVAKTAGTEKYVTSGYCTLDERIWICDECFKDFVPYFEWKVIE